MIRNTTLLTLLFAAMTLFAQSTPPAPGTPAQPAAAAQAAGPITSPCFPSGRPLQRIPELVSGADGVLRGTLYTVSEQVSMQDLTFSKCQPQIVRAYRLEPGPNDPPNSLIADPLPGPTLRARVGDLIALTFMNQIDPIRFPNADGPCDAAGNDQTKVTSYPGQTQFSDRQPDCLNGSVYTNMHFHGTHTSPQTTADNVFLMIAPSPRAEQSRAPAVTRQTVSAPLGEFFADCEAQLPRGSAPKQWPRVWNDFPKSWRDLQEGLLRDNYPKLLAANRKAIEQGNFPQYYTGAFPYCFRLPEYTQSKWPPVSKAETLTPHTHGAGSAEIDEAEAPRRPLIMGQAPGTHWYHAHKHGSTTINVMNGMTGAFIIEGKYDDDIDKVYGAGWTRRQPVIVINQLAALPALLAGGAGFPGPLFSVNGRMKPTITMAPGEVQLWRIVNSSARSSASFVKPGGGLQWRVLARDGVQFTQHNYDNSADQPFLIASGNRIDLLVKAPAGGAAAPIPVQAIPTVNPTRLGASQDLLTVTVTGNPVTMDFLPTVPEFPPYLANIEDEEITGTKKLVFATTNPPGARKPAIPAQHTIDGKKFDGELGVVVGMNRVEEWTVISETYAPAIAHPFHIHVNPFQVTEVFAPTDSVYVYVKPDPANPAKCFIDPQDRSTWKPCALARPGIVKPEDRVWWDVFPIPAGIIPKDASGNTFKDKDGKDIQIPGYFKMRSRFVDYSGYFVLHCHILAHEDRGMMTVVQVAPLQTPFSHH
jgi:FtsP/CotA-like multicopper oxidase with cupredoxin domain